MRKRRLSEGEKKDIEDRANSRVNERFCNECSGPMTQHPEFEVWWKCGTCGFCKRKGEENVRSRTSLTVDKIIRGIQK